MRQSASCSFEQLETEFESVSVDATLICAGLRRDEFLTRGPLFGELPWGADAASPCG